MNLKIRETSDGVVFQVRVQPRASANHIAGTTGDFLKLRLTAPPVEGKANEACRKFLAELFSVPRAQIEIISGAASRNKTIKITGITARELQEILSSTADVN
jgi:uncharacterized protein (TIGR00251 family)